MNICRLRRSPSVPQGAAMFELTAIDKSTKARRGHLQTAHGLRKQSAQAIVDLDFGGYTIGGVSVDEPEGARTSPV
jgi:queuine/archaeosine tRNA-ribosyltransferase